MTTNHTSGPLAPLPYAAQTTRIIDAKGNSIASGGNNRAIQGRALTDTLAHIVRCVNAHDELVAALARCATSLALYGQPSAEGAVKQARAALAKVTL